MLALKTTPLAWHNAQRHIETEGTPLKIKKEWFLDLIEDVRTLHAEHIEMGDLQETNRTQGRLLREARDELARANQEIARLQKEINHHGKN